MKKMFLMTALGALLATPVANAKTFSLTIVNKTSSVIEAFYASPINEADWEEDLLGEDAIPVGGRYTVRFEDSRNVCRYDLRFEFRDKSYDRLEDTQNLCELVEYEVTD